MYDITIKVFKAGELAFTLSLPIMPTREESAKKFIHAIVQGDYDEIIIKYPRFVLTCKADVHYLPVFNAAIERLCAE